MSLRSCSHLHLIVAYGTSGTIWVVLWRSRWLGNHPYHHTLATQYCCLLCCLSHDTYSNVSTRNCYSPHHACIFVVFDETKGHISFSCGVFGLASTIILMGDGVQWIRLVLFVEGSRVGRVLVWGRWEGASSNETHPRHIVRSSVLSHDTPQKACTVTVVLKQLMKGTIIITNDSASSVS
jgi:hypothetical protein